MGFGVLGFWVWQADVVNGEVMERGERRVSLTFRRVRMEGKHGSVLSGHECLYSLAPFVCDRFGMGNAVAPTLMPATAGKNGRVVWWIWKSKKGEREGDMKIFERLKWRIGRCGCKY